MMENIPTKSLKVRATMERDTGYIADGGDYSRLLVGISSTVLTDETLMPLLIDNINVANTISSNQHCDIIPESLSDKGLGWGGDDPQKGSELRRWRSVSHCVRSTLYYHVIKKIGEVFSRKIVQHITQDDFRESEITEQVHLFDEQLAVLL